jgi:hypothetical protein
MHRSISRSSRCFSSLSTVMLSLLRPAHKQSRINTLGAACLAVENAARVPRATKSACAGSPNPWHAHRSRLLPTLRPDGWGASARLGGGLPPQVACFRRGGGGVARRARYSVLITGEIYINRLPQRPSASISATFFTRRIWRDSPLNRAARKARIKSAASSGPIMRAPRQRTFISSCSTPWCAE